MVDKKITYMMDALEKSSFFFFFFFFFQIMDRDHADVQLNFVASQSLEALFWYREKIFYQVETIKN